MNSLTTEQLSSVLAKIPTLRAWATAVEAEALHRLANEKSVPGFKLVEGRAWRKWENDKQVEQALLDIGMSIDEIAPRSLLSPSATQKLLKKAKKTSEWGNINALVVQPRGKLAIAPDSDPRPAITRGSEFLEQDEAIDILE